MLNIYDFYEPLKKLIDADFYTKILETLPLFLGKEYSSDDNNGITYSFEHYDCVTLIEIMTSMFMVKNFTDQEKFKQEFENNLMYLRFNSKPYNLLTRRHFTNIDWIKGFDGIVADITLKYDDKHGSLVRSQTEIDVESWFKKTHDITLDEHIKPVLSEINYLNSGALEKVLADLNKFPDVALVLFVRPNWDLIESIGTKLDVSHVGFVIKKDGKLHLLHASSNAKQVVLVDFIEYCVSISAKSPTMKGVNIQEVNPYPSCKIKLCCKENCMSGWEQFGLMLLMLFFGFSLFRYIKHNPEALTKVKFMKASNTMLLLAIVLIGFLGTIVMLLKGS